MAKEIDLGDSSDVKSDEEKELEAVLAEFGGASTRWQVYCAAPREKAGHVVTWEGDEEVTLERISREFGAGEYRIRAIGIKGKILGGKNVKISPNSQHERERAKAALVPITAQPRQEMTTMELITLLNSGNQSMQAMMFNMMKSQSDVLIALLGKPTPPAPNGMDANAVVQMMASMQSMFKPEGSGVDTLLKGLELGRTLESGGGETDFLTIAAKGLDVLGGALKNAPTENPSPRRKLPVRAKVVPAHPQPTVSQPATPQPRAVKPAPEDPMLRKLNWLKMQLNALLHQASRDSDPMLYAAVLLDNLPDFISEEEILQRFSDAAAVAQLALIDVRVEKFRDWFERFRTQVLEQLADDGEDEISDNDAMGGPEDETGED